MKRFTSPAAVAALLMVARIAAAAGEDEKAKEKAEKPPASPYEIRVEVQQFDKAVKLGPLGTLQIHAGPTVPGQAAGKAGDKPGTSGHKRIRVVEVRPGGAPIEFNLDFDVSVDAAAKSGVADTLEEILKRDDLKLSDEARKAIRAAKEAAQKADELRVTEIRPAIVGAPVITDGMPVEVRKTLERALEAQRKTAEEVRRATPRLRGGAGAAPPAAIEAKLDKILERLERLEQDVKALKTPVEK